MDKFYEGQHVMVNGEHGEVVRIGLWLVHVKVPGIVHPLAFPPGMVKVLESADA